MRVEREERGARDDRGVRRTTFCTVLTVKSDNTGIIACCRSVRHDSCRCYIYSLILSKLRDVSRGPGTRRSETRTATMNRRITPKSADFDFKITTAREKKKER